MSENSNVLAEVQREVKGFGENVRGLQESMNRDLAAVRAVAEEAKAAAGQPEVKAQIDALALSVAEKHAALEQAAREAKARAEGIETALRRTGAGAGPESQDERKAALSFFETKAAAFGSSRPTAETVDVDGYKAWAGAFGAYLRRDERAVEAKALSVGSDPDGGYLVPVAQSARILSKVYESSPVRPIATVETIGTDALELPVDDGEAAAGWVGETEARPETGTARIGVHKINVHEIYAKPRATQKMLEDAAINVEAWLANKTGELFGRIEASGFVNGTGNKQPRGFLTYPAGEGRNRIAQVASGHASQLTADGLVLLTYALKGAYLANARFLMKRSTVAAVALLKDGQGNYIWRAGIEAGRPSMLLGYPVAQADDMPVVGAGALAVAFGDFRAGYTIVDRLGITTLRDPFSSKPFVEFYSRKRVGGDVTTFEALALQRVAAS